MTTDRAEVNADEKAGTMNREAVIQRAIDEWAVIGGGPHAHDTEQVTLAHHIDASLYEYERRAQAPRFINGG